jgi:phage gp16-like protein
MSAAARQHVSSPRRAMLAKVHLAAKELGLKDEERRDVLERLTGHRSSADCTDAQLDQVLAHFRSLGWKPVASKAPQPRHEGGSKPVRKPAETPIAGKARALWASLWNLGVVRQGTEAALEAFAKRQLGVDRLQWADAATAFRLIEALKAMAEREGWSQDLALVKPERHVWALKARLVQRQAQILGRPPVNIGGLSEAQLDRMARDLGVEVRAQKAAG